MIDYKKYQIVILGQPGRNGKICGYIYTEGEELLYKTKPMTRRSSAVRAAKRFIDQYVPPATYAIFPGGVKEIHLVEPSSFSNFGSQFGERKNDNKTQFSYLDLDSMEDMCKVLEFGAKKYARDNWKKGFPVSSILDSMLRHINEIMKGNLVDQESSLPHSAHIQCNAMFLAFTLKHKPDCYDFTKLQPAENQLENK